MKKSELIEAMYENPMPITGPVKIDIEILEKLWDYRFLVYKIDEDPKYKIKEEYRLCRYVKRGSPVCQKVTISKEQALEIIKRLSLVLEYKHVSTSFYRQEGFSEFDMMRKAKK